MSEAEATTRLDDAPPSLSPSPSGMSVLTPLLFGHAAAMTLKAVVELRIPDILGRAEPAKPRLSVHEIAQELPSHAVDEQALHRIMRALVHLGVFEVEDEQGGARYGLTPASRMLVRENNPRTLAPMVMYVNYRNSQTPWQHLCETVLHGRNAWEACYGKSSWEYSDVDPEYGELWSLAEKVQGAQKIEALKCYGSWKEVETLVDVGGFQGTTVAAIVAAHPHIRGINFDLPHAVAAAPSIPGVEHVAGDLLDSDIPCGDTMLLKNVVHLFNDEVAIKVLQNCKKSLPSEGKLLIYDPIVPSEFGGESPYTRVPPLMDLVLLVHAGGVDRTEEQWTSLLSHAGFSNIKFISLQPQHWLIEASQ